jgi:hypothetical protein
MQILMRQRALHRTRRRVGCVQAGRVLQLQTRQQQKHVEAVGYHALTRVIQILMCHRALWRIHTRVRCVLADQVITFPPRVQLLRDRDVHLVVQHVLILDK